MKNNKMKKWLKPVLITLAVILIFMICIGISMIRF